MQITTVDALMQSLNNCKLFSPEQLLTLGEEVAKYQSNFQSALKHLVERRHLTVYQLRKLIHGKAEELFLGPYIVTDKLGEGGMGRVYRARHVRMGREVALKIIRPNLLSNPVIRGRYQREVEAAGTLRHPNIVCVDDAGEANGKYYMAMEFVDGVDLSRLIKDHPVLEVTEACEYIRQAALGLQHAHENGFVHRDIKPSNIIVSGERHVPHAKNPAVVKILDMGLVRPMGFDDVPGAADLTRAGTVVGTPDYMAPEQAKNSSSVDARADLYSLGCTLYFLLTGQSPFPEGTAVEKLLKHQLDPCPSVRILRPDVPEEIDAIIACLTAKKPEQRFPSAEIVAHTLGAHTLNPRAAGVFTPRAWPSHAISMQQTDRSALPTIPTAVPSSHGVTPSSRAIPVLPPLPPSAVAPSDPTPRPSGLPATVPALSEDPSPFATLADPPSVPLGLIATDAEAKDDDSPPPPRAPIPRMAWIVGGVVGFALLAVVVVITQLGGKPIPPPGPGPDPTPPVKRPSIHPKADTLARLHHHSMLVPDGSGLVVVAFPAVYLKEKDSPFVKGTGPVRLAQWANRLETETEMDLTRTDRLLYAAPAAFPDRYLLVSEGDYVTPAFTPKLFSLNNPFIKQDRRIKHYVASGGRHTAVMTPVNGAPVYAVMSNAGFLEELRPRFIMERTPPVPKLDNGMMPALNAIAERPPLLFAVAGESYKVPFGDNQTLADFGIELVTLKVQIQDRLELELVITGADSEVMKQGIKELSQLIRAEKTPWSTTVADLLIRQGIGDRLDSRYRWTIRTSWTADQFSTFLDQCLSQ